MSSVNGIKPVSGKKYELGYPQDISNGKNYAENTVVLKVNGNLLVKEGVTVTSISGDYGGPKGMVIYCTGNIQNEGSINMNGKGAYSNGQNVFLYKNSNGNYEFIPKYGANGGAGVSQGSAGLTCGCTGKNGVGRRNCWWKWWCC